MPSALAQAYRRHGEAAGTAAADAAVVLALSGSAEALRAIASAPARKRHPALVLAALRDLALAGRAPEPVTADAAVETLLTMTDEVVAILTRRSLRPVGTSHAAVLRPALAEAAHRVGATSIGLVDVGCSAGLDLIPDRVGITYDTGQRLGDPSAPVQLSASVVGGGPVPSRPLPEVVVRTGLDDDPLDVTDADDARWLRARLGPDRPGHAARLEAEIAATAAVAPTLLRGNVLDLLPEAFARVPADVLPVITTAWALPDLTPADRLRFLQRLDDAATHRAVAWVSVEGVGVAPAVPTRGDRRASGHSTIGLVVLRHATLHAEALGRSWSRGRLLSYR